MTKRTLTALAAAILLACPGAASAETIHYRVGLATTGTWSEAVRADLDADDLDHDGTEEVAARDSSVRFALTAVLADVPFRAGRVVEPFYDVAQTTLTQEATSTTTDFYGTAGTCAPQAAAATGGGTIASAGAQIVFRPSSDAVLDLVCDQPLARWSMSVDLLRVAASKDVPDLGAAPIDAAFTLGRRFGDWRITLPVAASPAQRAFERCPREDPGHTVACPFGWDGTVTLDRLTPEVRRPQPARVTIRCATACAPVVRAGSVRKTLRVPAGAERRVAVPRARRAVVTIGDERFVR